MVKKDKIQDSLCCISIATLIGGVATISYGQWWLLIIAIILIVISLWWLATASTSIEAEAGRCKVNFNGPLKWVDTHHKENAIMPVLKGHIIKPSAAALESQWAQYVEEAKQTLRKRVSNLDEEILDTFDVELIMKIVDNLIQRNVGEYMKAELARPRHRAELESSESGDNEGEHPYSEVVFYSPMKFREILAGEPSGMTVDNYPDNDGIDVHIKTLEVAMIGMPMIQSTIPLIIILPWLFIMEIIVDQLMRDDEPDGEKEILEEPEQVNSYVFPARKFFLALNPAPPATPTPLSPAPNVPRNLSPALPLIENKPPETIPVKPEPPQNNPPMPEMKPEIPFIDGPVPLDGPEKAGIMVMACVDLWGRHVGKKLVLRKGYSQLPPPLKQKTGRSKQVKKKKHRGSK